MRPDHRSRIRGSLLAGAIGDALGAPVEFHSLSEIRRLIGPAGVTGFLPAYGLAGGAITDDTQMTLFTADGLIRALVRDTHYGIVDAPAVMLRAYQRWLATQGEEPIGVGHPVDTGTSWLMQVPGLHARRAPGSTCLSSLRSGSRGSVDSPINQSKGCGAVMRAAPIGLIGNQGATAFDFGVRVGALTHGHPDGYLSAGFLAGLLAALPDAESVDAALDLATDQLREYGSHDATLRAVEQARWLATAPGDPSPERVEQLGAGWVGEEALSIAIYCVLVSTSVRETLLLAVNHSGDTDSTGSIAGNIAGAIAGEVGLPGDLVASVELRDTIVRMADDLVAAFYEGAVGSPYVEPSHEIETFLARYPGY